MTPEIAKEWIEINQRAIARNDAILNGMYAILAVTAIVGLVLIGRHIIRRIRDARAAKDSQ